MDPRMNNPRVIQGSTVYISTQWKSRKKRKRRVSPGNKFQDQNWREGMEKSGLRGGKYLPRVPQATLSTAPHSQGSPMASLHLQSTMSLVFFCDQRS